VLEDGTVLVSITDYAQEKLHEVVNVELPEVGAQVRQMEVFASVDSVKATSEIYAPVSGQVVEVNEEPLDKPELLNQDPYGQGWIARIKPGSQRQLENELKELVTAEEYVRECFFSYVAQ